MKIAIVLKGGFPVTLYGGTQRVMWGLGKSLAQMGHQVVYLVEKVLGSIPFADIVQLDASRSLYEQIPEDVDVVHLNEWQPDAPLMPKPYINTIHGNKVPDVLDANTVFVSRNHAERFGSHSYVYNGICWDELGDIPLHLPRQNYHFLAKAAWSVKNVRGAIRIVKGIPGAEMDVLGGTRLNFKMGFRLTLSPRIHFHGMVDDCTKYRTAAQSRGLIFPVTWHEPFGLAIIESMYAGAPVFATPYGAIPELVTGEHLGFLTNSEAEMRYAIVHAGDFDPIVLHEYARDNFHSDVMARAYLQKYETVMNGLPLTAQYGARTPQYRNLEWRKK